MHIKELHIDGFGVYHDREIQTGAPLTVFYGPNEAGKSTLLAFIRTVLYGFPSSTSSKWYPPLSGGQHSGRLIIADDSGTNFTVERQIGPKGGPLIVRSSGNEMSNGQNTVERLCGQQPRNVFENVLSFNLSELPKLGSENENAKNNITREFYSAAIGARKFQEVKDDLQKRQRDIFTTNSGKQKRLWKKLARLEELEKLLREIEGQSANYADTTRQIDERTTALHLSEKQEKKLQSRRDELKRYVESWPVWCQIRKLESTLPAVIPGDEFPDNPIERLEELENTIGEHQDAVEAFNATIADTRVQAERPVIHEKLIGESAQCDGLVNGVEKHQDACVDLNKRQVEVDKNEEAVAKELLELGNDWTKEQISALDVSITKMDQVDAWQTKFDELQNRLQTLQLALNTLDESCRQQTVDVTRLENDIAPSTDDELDTNIKLVQTALDRHTTYIRALENQPMRGRSSAQFPIPPRWIVWGFLITLLTFGLAIFFELPWLGAASLLGFAGVGVGLVDWFDSMRHKYHQTVHDTTETAKPEDRRQEYAEVLKQLKLGNPESVDVSDLTKIKDRWSDEIRNRQALTSARKILITLEDQKVTQREMIEAHNKQIEETTVKWREWLRLSDFPETLQPNNVEGFAHQVKEARHAINSLKKEKNRLYGITQNIKEYREQVKKLADRHDIPLDDSIADATIWTNQIKTLLQQANNKQGTRENARNKLRDSNAQHKTTSAALNREMKKLENLLNAAQAKDVEEFRRKAKEWLRTQATIRQLESKRGELRAMWVNNYTDEELANKFQNRADGELEDELAQLNESLSKLKNEHKTNNRERGQLEAERKRMDGDEQASKYRAEREIRRTEANELAEEWSTLIVAQWLLNQAHRKYEKERQPAVIQSASKWFKQMTNGNYINIVPPTDRTSEFSVVNKRERTLAPNQLSQGTQDQLYLALRFGLIESIVGQGERLPVIVDEALVNCDPARAKVAASAFAELAQKNQVLVMTCHPWVRDLFVEASQNVQVVELAP